MNIFNHGTYMTQPKWIRDAAVELFSGRSVSKFNRHDSVIYSQSYEKLNQGTEELSSTTFKETLKETVKDIPDMKSLAENPEDAVLATKKKFVDEYIKNIQLNDKAIQEDPVQERQFRWSALARFIHADEKKKELMGYLEDKLVPDYDGPDYEAPDYEAPDYEASDYKAGLNYVLTSDEEEIKRRDKIMREANQRIEQVKQEIIKMNIDGDLNQEQQDDRSRADLGNIKGHNKETACLQNELNTIEKSIADYHKTHIGGESSFTEASNDFFSTLGSCLKAIVTIAGALCNLLTLDSSPGSDVGYNS